MRPTSEASDKADRRGRGIRESASKRTNQWRVINPQERQSPILDEMMAPIITAVNKAVDQEKDNLRQKIKRNV